MIAWWIFGFIWFGVIGSRFPGRVASIKTRFAYAFGLMLFVAILIATVRYQAGTRPDDYDPELKQPSAADDAQEFQV